MNPPLIVTAEPTSFTMEVGTAISLSLSLAHADQTVEAVRLDRVNLDEPSPARLNPASPHLPVTIRPGETYRLLLVLEAVTPGQLDLGQIRLSGPTGEVSLPSCLINVVPAFPSGIKLEAGVLSKEEGLTHLRVRLDHQGQVVCKPFRLKLSAVTSGPQVVHRAELAPGDRLEFDLWTEAAEIIATLEGCIGGVGVRQVRQLSCEQPPPVTTRRETFRFVNPGTLPIVRQKIEREYRDVVQEEVKPDPEGRYWLWSGYTYRLSIQAGSEVSDIEVTPVPQRVFLRKSASQDGDWWRCKIEVAGRSTFRQRELLHYHLRVDQAKQARQIPIGILPAFSTRAILALSLGGALMAQGVLGLGPMVSRLLSGEPPVWDELLAGFTARGDWNLLRLMSVPIFLGGLWAADLMHDWFVE